MADENQLTMQNAVLHHFYGAEVTIKFTNRTSGMLFNRQCFEWIQERVNRTSSSLDVLTIRVIDIEITT